jgi:hypothetical protein
MTEAEVLARRAGLEKAWRDHQADVEEAIATIARLRQGFARPQGPEAEPVPPYRAPAAPGRPA